MNEFFFLKLALSTGRARAWTLKIMNEELYLLIVDEVLVRSRRERVVFQDLHLDVVLTEGDGLVLGRRAD